MVAQLWRIRWGTLLAGLVWSDASAETATFSPLHPGYIYYISYGEQLASADGHAQMKIDTKLAEEIATNRDTGHKFPVIIKLQSSDGVSALQQRGITPDLVYQNMPGFSATLTADQIQAIGTLPEVELIELDSKAWTLQGR